MKFLYLILLCLSLITVAVAQSPATIKLPSEQSPTEQARPTILLSPSLKNPIYHLNHKDCSFCDEGYFDGNLLQNIENNQVQIGVSARQAYGARTMWITITNVSAERIEFDPATIFFETSAKAPKSLTDAKEWKVVQPLDPDQVTAKIASRTRVANAIGAASGSFSTQTATVRDQQGNTATVTMPDQNAQARSANQSASNNNRAATIIDFVNGTALRRTTIMPGKSVTGTVFFKNKDFTVGHFVVPLNGYQYVFIYFNK